MCATATCLLHALWSARNGWLSVADVTAPIPRRFGRVQVVPEWLHRAAGREGGGRGGVEARGVEQRQYALLRGRREVRFEPCLLGRADACGDVSTVAVQHDDVPGAQVVAVVALGGIAGLRSPVPEVPTCGRARVVVAVAGHRGGAGLVPPPAPRVAVLIHGGGATRVGAVAHHEHVARDGVEDRGGGFVVGAVAARDTAGADERDRCRRAGG